MADLVIEPMEDDIVIEPIESKDASEEPQAVPPKKKGGFARQVGASILDLGATLPAIPGIVQAAGELAYKSATNDAPFSENLVSSLDNKLLQLANKGYNWSSDVTGAGEPETGPEQLGRLASFLIPITAGTNLLRGGAGIAQKLGATAATAQKAGKATELATNVLTPLIKVTKKEGAPLGGYLHAGNVGRYGSQAGIAVGLDQGVRTLADQPTMFSSNEPVVEEIPADEPVVVDPNELPLSQLYSETGDTLLDKQLDEEEARSTKEAIALGVGAAASMFGIYKWRQFKARKAMLSGETAPLGVAEPTRPKYLSPSEAAHAKLVDQNTHITGALKAAGHEEKARELSGQINTSAADEFGDFAATGTVGHNINMKVDVPLNTWARQARVIEATEFPELGGVPGKDALDMYFAIKYERQNRIRATAAKEFSTEAIEGKSLDELEDMLRGAGVTDKNNYVGTGLFASIDRKTGKFVKTDGPMKNSDLYGNTIVDTIDQLPDVHPIKQHINASKQLGELGLGVLEKRGIINSAQAAKWRNQATMLGDYQYIPGMEAVGTAEVRLVKWLKKVFGPTDEGKAADELSSLMQQAMDEGKGIMQPMDHVTAMSTYLFKVMDFANRNNAKKNVLVRLANPAIDIAGDGRVTQGRKLAHFLGEQDPDLGDVLPKWVDDLDPEVAAKFEVGSRKPTPASINRLANEVVWVKDQGKNLAYYVPDAELRRVVRLEPKMLSALNEVGRTFKNTFHATTVRLPMFVPISSAYQVQQTTLNALAHGVKFNPFIDPLRGMKEAFSTRFAIEMSNQIAYSLETNTGLFKTVPGLAKTIQARLQKTIKDSVFLQLQRESGGFSTGLGGHETYSTARDVMKLAAPGYKDNYSALGSAWRVYNYLADSMRESAAIGLGMRMIKDRKPTTAGQMRMIGQDVRDIAGDIRRVGSSKAAETVQSWIPFSGPMLDAWNTIGIAAKKNPGRFAMSVGASIVTPTIVEMAYNNSLGPEYRDYYWNKLTTEQRNNNMIIMIPGLPPERAVVYPITPEWSLARAISIEFMDMIGGYSNTGAAGVAGENGQHIQAAIERMFDLPPPPPVQALAASQGQVMRVGPKFDEVGDLGSLPFQMHDMGRGEQISGSRGRTRYVDGVMDTETDGVFKALVGGVASIYSGIAESVRQGGKESKEVAFDYGLEQLGTEVAKQAKYTNPLFPSLRPNANDEIADSVRVKKDGLTRMNDTLNVMLTKGRVHSMDTPHPFLGNSLDPSQDPIMMDAANYVLATKFQSNLYDSEIATIRKDMTDVAASSRYKGRLISRKERDELVDNFQLQIRTKKAEQLALLEKAEQSLSDDLSEKYGREIDINFATYQPRANPGTGLVLPAPMK